MCFVDSHPSVVAAASTTTTRSVMCVCQARRGLLRSVGARELASLLRLLLPFLPRCVALLPKRANLAIVFSWLLKQPRVCLLSS